MGRSELLNSDVYTPPVGGVGAKMSLIVVFNMHRGGVATLSMR